MRLGHKRLIAAAMMWFSLAAPPVSFAQQTPVLPAPVPVYDSARMRVAVDGLVAVLKAEPKEAEVFSPGFLAAVPPAQIRMLAEQIRSQFGPDITGADIEMVSANSARLLVHYSKADVMADATITATGAPTFDGLLITGTKVSGDSFAAVASDFAALPGQASFALVRLDGAVPQTIARAGEDRSYALGSAFKLFILNELAHQIVAGRRSWSDTVPLTAKSFPSGVMQDWPRDLPVTLATLATQMISISDNTATDQLITTLGREAIEARIAKDGISDPERMLPFLSTIEAFALKSPANAELRQQFIASSEAAQRRLLHDARDRLTLDKVDFATLAGNTPM